MVSTNPPAGAIQLYIPTDQRGRATLWGSQSDAQRRLTAAAAASSHNVPVLIDITIAYLLLRGRRHATASDHTIRSYAAGVRALVDRWRQENLLHPSTDAGYLYVAYLSERHAPATCASRLAAAIALYRALRWVRATDADPFMSVRAPANHTPRHERRHPYTDAAVSRIVAAADDRLALIILLCAHGGLRIAEALQLTWSDVRLADNTLRVTSGKGRKSRTVNLSATLAAALSAAAGAGAAQRDRVVARADGAGARDASWLRRRLELACQAANVEYLGWHAFRHTAGTRLARETGNLQLVAAHLGHADVSTAAIYAKWSDQQLRDQVSQW